ncbi:MAG: branched-chain amino acid ABC transporter substrate-binding protein, partial [Burkholderiales bacterium]|nr:branched-chain amino acid ABC transporter substrate-binding protein [Burkholderiales bacterium]
MARVLILLAMLPSAASANQDSIRIAVIEQLSGPFANIGTSAFHELEATFSMVNARGGALGRMFELVPLDNHGTPQGAALQVKAAVDRQIRYVIQGSGSNVAHAISDAVAKHNARSPDRPLLYLNHGALDPALTEEKCHFWHFRFVPHGGMIMNALTDAIARDPSVRRVYLVNQDYAWGQSVARDAKQMLAARRPDIEIAGEDLHPIGKVKDFAPYVAKLRAARADALITGSWGNDLALLIKAVKDAKSPVKLYAPLASLTGAPTSMGEAGAGRVKAVLFWHENLEPNSLLSFAQDYRSKYNEDWNWLPNVVLPEMLAQAMTAAGSIDPLQVAQALEGMRYDGPTGEVWMRAEDHQIMMPVFQ